MKVLIFFYELFKKFPFLFILNTLVLLAVSVFGVLSFCSIAPIIDYFVSPGAQGISVLTQKIVTLFKSLGLPLTLGTYLVFFLLFQILRNAFYLLARWTALKTWNVVWRTIFVETLEKIFSARWLFFSSNRQGTLFNTLTRETEMVGQGFRSAVMLLSCFLQIIFYLSIPFYLSWQVTSISLMVSLLFAAPIYYLSGIGYNLGKEATNSSNELTHVMQESLSLAKLIIGFGNQKKNIEKTARSLYTLRKIVLKANTLKESIPLIYEPVGVLVIVIGFLVSKRLMVPLSDIGVIFLALRYVIPLLATIITQNNALANFCPSYEQIKKLKTEAEILKQGSGERSFIKFEKIIYIENVSFAYPDHDLALRDISIKIPKGKMVAIVGESGSGKSTLIDMIMGFNEPREGRIMFDGVDLRDFNIDSYRKRIGYVPQESVLFNMSIKDNLLWAKEDATNEGIKRACVLANADEFISEFPKGYGTMVGDRGICLSGGQCQRIALARAILREPVLLILDEATSSLDTRSERLIQQAVERIAKETTIVVIAHRLSTIANADYIYVLKNGKVVEEGAYSELIEIGGHFNQMARLQLLESK
ncbi:MAG: ABC transporter ATP-binding protein [Candidatus Omnitrophota bacterium]